MMISIATSFSAFVLCALLSYIPPSAAFTSLTVTRSNTAGQRRQGVWGAPPKSTTSTTEGEWSLRSSRLALSAASATVASITTSSTDTEKGPSSSLSLQQEEEGVALRAPLKYIGPYACLALSFPNLASSGQRERNVTGVSLDFVLDTAANTNTIQQHVASELELDVVGQALPGVGAAGVIAGAADTFMLGDAQLEGIVPEEDGEEPFTFMTGLTASALPVASPASAGLLSFAFLQTFAGGVDFSWGNTVADSSNNQPPSVTFYGDKSMDEKAGLLQGRTKVTIDRIPVTQLPSVTVSINGVEMPALLDTGSPITVINAQAAALAGVETTHTPAAAAAADNNPLKAFANRFRDAQAAARGEILMIQGTDGRPINLVKTSNDANVELVGDQNNVEFGSSPVYVGELPGLAALNGLGVESPPAVVLGLDVLRKRPSMLLRAQDNEVWFD